MSRMARQATHIAGAVTPPPAARATRLSLSRFAHRPSNPTKGSGGSSDTTISATSPDFSAHDLNLSQSNRKRKRGTPTATTSAITSVKTESTEIRRSPRKTPKLEPSHSTRKPKRQPAKQIKHEDGQTTTEPPSNWEEIYAVTTEFRKGLLAPVDTMGCENLAEDHRPPLERRLQTLVALMLSSQTKDTVTAAAMKNLQQNLPGGFTLKALLEISQSDLNTLIQKVGFHNNKAKFIKQTAEILRDKFGGDIPDTIEGLTSLPGVGPKMAYLTMSSAWGRDEGIGVDVHVHRITNLWGWHKTTTPEQTRAALEAWLPREKWHDINHLLVGLGQTICLPVGRRCGECDLNAKNLCPSAVAGSPAKRRIVKKEIKIEVKTEGRDDEDQLIAVETDDHITSLHIKSEDLGEIDAELNIGSIPDIEGVGAGQARKIARLVETL